MRYAQIRKLDITNGEGIGISLFTQGCPFHCENCFNKETWDFRGGKEYTEDTKNIILNLVSKKHIQRFSILGGEPLIKENIEELIELIKLVKINNPNIKIWLYTGNTFEKALNLYPELISLLDIIVDGQFIDALKNLNLEFRGSSNQRVIDVQKTLKENKIIEYL